MMADDFLQLPETNRIIQLIEGEVIVSPAPLIRHQFVLGNLFDLVRHIVPDGVVFVAPTDVYFTEVDVLQPDIFWVSDKNERCVAVDGKYFRGAPDLVIEVLSPGTERYDKTLKFLIYEKHGVLEYWIADPANRTLEVWVHRGEEYVRQGIYGADQTFDSAVLGGKSIAINAIFRD